MSKQINFSGSGMKINTGADESSGLLSKIYYLISILKNPTFLIVSIIFIFISIAIYHYYYVVPNKKAVYKPNHEHMNNSTNNTKTAELLLFCVDWCPHSKTAKPVWNDIKAQYENKTINGYKVIFTEINCTEETAEVEEMMNKYNIEGFPTIKLLKDGQIVEYDAKPTKATLEQFLNTVL